MSNETETMNVNPQPPAQNKKRLSIPWKKGGIVLLLLVLVSLIYSTMVLCHRLTTLHTQVTGYFSNTADSMQKMQSVIVDIQKKSNAVQDTTEEMAKSYPKLMETVQTMANNDVNRQSAQWRLEQARYYINLANASLVWGGNVPSALTLLTLAQDVVKPISEPGLTPVQKALAEDIAILQAIPLVNINAIYAKLTEINQQIDHLPLINKPTDAISPSSKQQSSSGWQATWQALRQIVVVRYQESGKMPLIPPMEQGFLYQNLHAVLFQAMWALLHDQPSIYRESLALVSTWIKQYGILNDPITEALLNNLTELEKTDIHPTIPAMANVLQVFAREMN